MEELERNREEPRRFGGGRWPMTTVMAIVAAGFLTFSGEWLWGAVLMIIALVLGTLTFRSSR